MWQSMELDCLILIFQTLSLQDLALSVPFVCKAWHKASLDPACWRILDFTSFDFMPWSDFTTRFMSQFAIRRFSFSGFLKLAVARSRGTVVELKFPVFGASLKDLVFASDQLSNHSKCSISVFKRDVIAYIICSCPSLRAVALPNLSLADEPQMPKLVEKWKGLEQLQMELKPSSFVDMVTRISLGRSKRFCSLRMAGSIKKEDTTAIVNLLPGIKHLDLSKSYLPREQLLDLINGCRELQSLIVDNCVGFEADEEIFKKASGIKLFRHEACILLDQFAYDTDEYDPLDLLVV